LDDRGQKAKRRRHIHRYLGTHQLTLFQAVQNRPIPPGTTIVSFYGNKPGSGLLLGSWSVGEHMPTEKAIEAGLLNGTIERREELASIFHVMHEEENLADLRMRLQVAWPEPAVQWKRWLKTHMDKMPCEVIEGCPVQFEEASTLSLTMAELKMIVVDPEWMARLSSLWAIYLILDQTTGLQYVGSATGDGGLLKRWRQYVDCGHGGNLKLIDLLDKHHGRENEFRFSILRRLPSDTSRKSAIDEEGRWKLMLGSRAFGLNLN